LKAERDGGGSLLVVGVGVGVESEEVRYYDLWW